MKPKYQETQKFNQWWLWLILICVYLSPFILRAKDIVNQGFWGAFNKGILAHIVTLGLVLVLFLLIRLETTIDSKGIEIQYFPFLKKEFKWQDIKEGKPVNYTFWQVLGWGIRIGTRYGTVYNIKGNKGIFLQLKNKKKYMIGTQDPEEVRKILDGYLDTES